MSANARPIDLFRNFRYKTAKKFKKALEFLYHFTKTNLTLDRKIIKKKKQKIMTPSKGYIFVRFLVICAE